LPQGASGFGFVVKHPAGGRVLLVAPAPLATAAAARAAMRQALALGQTDAAYVRSVNASGQHLFQIEGAAHEPLAGPEAPFATAEAMEAAVTDLIADLRALGSGESLALVEDLLLRPLPRDPAHPENDEPFLPVCVDPNCHDCGDDD